MTDTTTPTPPSRGQRFVLHVCSTHEDYGPTWAFMEIDPDYARAILHRRDVLLECRRAAVAIVEVPPIHMDYGDGIHMFEPCSKENDDGDLDALSELLYDLSSDGYAVLPEDLDLPSYEGYDVELEEIITEGDHMIVSEGGVCWAAYPKHTGGVFTTAEIDYAVIEQIAKASSFPGQKTTTQDGATPETQPTLTPTGTRIDPADGFERTTLQLSWEDHGSIDILDPDKRLVARINLFLTDGAESFMADVIDITRRYRVRRVLVFRQSGLPAHMDCGVDDGDGIVLAAHMTNSEET